MHAGSTDQHPLSPFRITNLQIDYTDDNDTSVIFTLLDRAPIVGDAINLMLEASLDVLVSTITSAVNSEHLMITLSPPTWDHTYKLIAKPNSLTEQNQTVYIPADSNHSFSKPKKQPDFL